MRSQSGGGGEEQHRRAMGHKPPSSNILSRVYQYVSRVTEIMCRLVIRKFIRCPGSQSVQTKILWRILILLLSIILFRMYIAYLCAYWTNARPRRETCVWRAHKVYEQCNMTEKKKKNLDLGWMTLHWMVILVLSPLADDNDHCPYSTPRCDLIG